jgi:hypothetical protein
VRIGSTLIFAFSVVLCWAVIVSGQTGNIVLINASTPCGPVIGLKNTSTGLLSFLGSFFVNAFDTPPFVLFPASFLLKLLPLNLFSLGLRYGKDTSGSARWQPSQASPCWNPSQPYNATQVRAKCVQIPNLPIDQRVESEDCLFLNVFTMSTGSRSFFLCFLLFRFLFGFLGFLF